MPALDVKVVPADTDRFGVGHGFNTSPSDGAPAAIASAAGKIRDKAQLLAGMALGRAARDARRGRTAPGSTATAATRRRSRRSRTSRCTRTAPARCRPASRAGSTRRPSTATERTGAAVELDRDLVDDLERAEQRRVRLHAPVGLRDDGAARERAVVADVEVERERARRARPASGRPARVEPPSPPARPRVERNVIAWRFRTSSSIVCSMFALSSSPSACIPPVPSSTRSDAASAVELDARGGGSSPTSSVASQEVTWMQQVVAGLGRGAGAPGPHREGAVVGPEPVRACRKRHAPSLYDP